MVNIRRRKVCTASPTAQERIRPLQILLRFGELLALFCFYGARFGIKLLLSKLTRRPCCRQALLGTSLARLCETSGATFIKIGQILSTRCDLFPQEIIVPLVRLQDHIKPFAFRHVRAIIQEQFHRPLEEVFIEFDKRPVSSASIACVYRARLHNGQWVAVKIRRPDIVSKVHNDLHLVRFIAQWLSLLPALRFVPIVEMVNDLGQRLAEQVDLRIEARNTRHFRALFAQDEHVHVPALIEQYCSEAVLVMEFINHLVRIDELDWTEDEYQAALMTGLSALYRMIFLDGSIHCDLHPGNLYLCKGGGVVILDTGFVARMEQAERFQFAQFFLGIVTNSGKNCARIIYETASYKPPTLDREQFDQAVIDLIARNAGSKAATFQVAAFAFQVFDIQRRFGLRSSTSFTMAILSLLVFEGIAKQIYPHLDFQAAARPFLLQAILQQ
jgi:ubiquinone biosynthesis protein